MNIVVLTAALSSCNSGLYSTGRILRSLAERGEAPHFAGRMSSQHVPYGGILFTGAVYLAGVFLNYITPDKVFDVAVAVASLGIISTWAVLIYCQLVLRKRALAGQLTRPNFRMPGAPYTNWFTLGFFMLVIGLMPFADAAQQFAFYLFQEWHWPYTSGGALCVAPIRCLPLELVFVSCYARRAFG